MGLTLAHKILREHIVGGEMVTGQEIAIAVDHTFTHDSFAPLVFLEIEAMRIERVRSRVSVCYADHYLLQLSYENLDDHRFLQGMSAKLGVCFSRPGNGICHQVHLERFSEPGATLLGTDSHTPTCGAVGMIAIGAGGLDVAVAMGGRPYHLRMPRVVQVKLVGRLPPWVASKDVALELLRRLTVKGGVGCIFEYSGDGVTSLTVPERATICNMGTELGATTSIFPSDEVVRAYLRAQGRESAWRALSADPDAVYDETIEIDLGALEPLIACPSSPDAVKAVREVEGTPVNQVCVGSCTNSSLADLSTVAAVLKGRTVHSGVGLTVTPGSRQVYQMIARTGALADLIDAGAQLLQSTCGPCIGQGQAPGTGAISLRTFNRNFTGRSGTNNDRVYLCSPQTAAAAALTGRITDPRSLGEAPRFDLPQRFVVDDRMILRPPEDPEMVEVFRGPGMNPLPVGRRLPGTLRASVVLKTGDNITTDHIVPSGAKVLPARHNIPGLSEYAFQRVDEGFALRAREAGGGIIVGGANYGQGSSRENAALVPMYLGISVVIAKSFARIHKDNLVNAGILPLTFASESCYDGVEQGDLLELAGVRQQVMAGDEVVVSNLTRSTTFRVRHGLTERQIRVCLDGGMLLHIRDGQP